MNPTLIFSLAALADLTAPADVAIAAVAARKERRATVDFGWLISIRTLNRRKQRKQRSKAFHATVERGLIIDAAVAIAITCTNSLGPVFYETPDFLYQLDFCSDATPGSTCAGPAAGMGGEGDGASGHSVIAG